MSKTDTAARFSLSFARKVHFSDNSSVRESFCPQLAEISTGVVDEIDHKIISIFNRRSTIDRNSP